MALVPVSLIKSYPFWVVLVPGERLLLSGDLHIRGRSLCLLSTRVSGEYPFQFQEVTPYKHRRKPSHKGTEANETTLGNARVLSQRSKAFPNKHKGNHTCSRACQKKKKANPRKLDWRPQYRVGPGRKLAGGGERQD